MKVQIPIVKTEDVSKKLEEIFKNQQVSNLSEEEMEQLEIQRIITGEDYIEEEPKKLNMAEINFDDISKPIDLYFKLSEVVSIYKAPDTSDKQSMIIVIGVNEYQAIFNQEQYDTIVDYLNVN